MTRRAKDDFTPTATADPRTAPFAYDVVKQLAASYLPNNRMRQARSVDALLVSRDQRIAELEAVVHDKDRALERYMEENTEVRGYIGRLRIMLADAAAVRMRAGTIDPDSRVGRLLDTIDRVLAVEIPGPGAKPERPFYRHMKGRVQLCAKCDRPELCAVLAPFTGPCRQNRVVSMQLDPDGGGT